MYVMPFCVFRRPLISALVLLGAIAGAGSITFGAAPLVMRIAPEISFAPTDLRVRLDIAPCAENRSLLVVAESEDFYRSSEIPLEAEEAPRSVTVQFRGLPGGEYFVSSEVRDADGRRLATVHKEIRVLPFTRTH
jgi:hypothetical protein